MLGKLIVGKSVCQDIAFDKMDGNHRLHTHLLFIYLFNFLILIRMDELKPAFEVAKALFIRCLFLIT